MIANILSFAIGFTALSPLDSLVHWSTGLTVVQIALSALMGAIIGIGQWIIVRQQIEKANHWVLTSMLGWGIGMPLSRWAATCDSSGVITSQFLEMLPHLLWENLVFGCVLGLAQWITVQPQIRGVVLWILATVFGWSANLGGVLIVVFMKSIIHLGLDRVGSDMASGLVFGIVMGVLYGATTGAMLVCMLNDARARGISSIPSK